MAHYSVNAKLQWRQEVNLHVLLDEDQEGNSAQILEDAQSPDSKIRELLSRMASEGVQEGMLEWVKFSGCPPEDLLENILAAIENSDLIVTDLSEYSPNTSTEEN